MAEHHLGGEVTQPFWDKTVEPRLEINPGDTVVFECPEPCGQVTPDWTDKELANINFDLIHALVGSLFVKGAEPGDALQVDVLDLMHKGWGWSGHLQDFGLLAEDFDFAYIHHWKLEEDKCHFNVNDIVVPYAPFCGTMGLTPADEGRHDTIAPAFNAGNVDIRDLGVSSRIWFPVFVEGALFAVGDCHSAQGQGELCGTGIESPMTVTLKFDVVKDKAPKELQFFKPGPLTVNDKQGYHVTTAHGPDLRANAQTAARYMIDWIVENHKITRSQAYVLCSTAGDLVISEIVDEPNYVVSLYMPLMIFNRG